jgi:hypothetical protein
MVSVAGGSSQILEGKKKKKFPAKFPASREFAFPASGAASI